MATIHRILKPGGVLLMTFPGISQRSNDNDEWSAGWHWSFTSKLAYRLFGEFYPVENFEICTYGNAHTTVAYLYGLALSEINQAALAQSDPQFELLISVRAIKPNS